MIIKLIGFNQAIPHDYFDILEKNIINYEFKDKNLLIEAFNVAKSKDILFPKNY